MYNAFCGELAHYGKSDTFSLWDHQTFELNKWWINFLIEIKSYLSWLVNFKRVKNDISLKIIVITSQISVT